MIVPLTDRKSKVHIGPQRAYPTHFNHVYGNFFGVTPESDVRTLTDTSVARIATCSGK